MKRYKLQALLPLKRPAAGEPLLADWDPRVADVASALLTEVAEEGLSYFGYSTSPLPTCGDPVAVGARGIGGALARPSPPLRLSSELSQVVQTAEAVTPGSEPHHVRRVYLMNSQQKTGTTAMEWLAAALFKGAVEAVNAEGQVDIAEVGGVSTSTPAAVAEARRMRPTRQWVYSKDATGNPDRFYHVAFGNRVQIVFAVAAKHKGLPPSPDGHNFKLKEFAKYCLENGIGAHTEECAEASGLSADLKAWIARGRKEGWWDPSIVIVRTNRDPVATAVSYGLFNAYFIENAAGILVMPDGSSLDEEFMIAECARIGSMMGIRERFATMIEAEGIEVHTFPYEEHVDDKLGFSIRFAEALGLASVPDDAMTRALSATSFDAMKQAQAEGADAEQYVTAFGVGGGTGPKNSRKVAHGKKFAYLNQLSPAVVQRCIDAVRPNTPPSMYGKYYSAQQ